MVAWFALVISLASLAVLVWDKFLRRADFDLQADWILSASEPVLRFAVLNVGYRKGVVRDIRLRQRDMPTGRGWTPYERVLSKLPLVLDADDASEPFLLETVRDASDTFERALRDGLIAILEIENARGDVVAFPLPELHVARHNQMTNAGPEIPKVTP